MSFLVNTKEVFRNSVCVEGLKKFQVVERRGGGQKSVRIQRERGIKVKKFTLFPHQNPKFLVRVLFMGGFILAI